MEAKPLLHAISTGKQSIDRLVDTARGIHPFVQAIHIREHDKSAREVYKIGKRLLTGGVPPGKIIINNRVDAAIALGVKGVQLGFHSLPVEVVKSVFPSLSVGKSVHSFQEAMQAEKEGADYILYGHVFPTNSKDGIAPKGMEELQKVTYHLNIPVIAIGGIKQKNVVKTMDTKVTGIAVLSGIFNAVDPIRAAKDYADILVNGDDFTNEEGL
ncbi:thiazole tautomerase TenI [Bacillus seohaeanensis]|uniref:Thiazole tautomerase TenI n=1 Tax=Bacillus seohaeanensis TaxID=284580 RepID=A0ABW5RMP7_9BACI